MKSTETLNAKKNHAKKLADDCALFVKNYKGKSYFKDLAEYLAAKTGVDYVLIGHLKDSGKNVKTVALFSHGKIVDDMEYPLNGTPCENVMGRNCCYYPDRVQQMFPDDKELRELNINSYIGAPLFDGENNPLGVIALMHSKMIQNAAEVEKALNGIMDRTQKELQKFVS